jgi:hypothetical protein
LVRRISFMGIFTTERGILEWNASVLPAGVELRSVVLQIELSGSKGPGTLRFYGYAGDGTAELGDAYAGTTIDASWPIVGLAGTVNFLTPAQLWHAEGRTIWGMNIRGAGEPLTHSVDEQALFRFSAPLVTRLVVTYADP